MKKIYTLYYNKYSLLCFKVGTYTASIVPNMINTAFYNSMSIYIQSTLIKE